jgi:L-ascorbate metabolism protein UlaG (beta-lactamase superfamily)
MSPRNAHQTDRPHADTTAAGVERRARALRSGLRRYPAALLESVAARDPDPEHALRDLLHELSPHAMAAVWLGHASLLLTLGDTTLAVDPVLSPRIGPRILGRTWGLARLQPPPVAPDALRGVDAVLLTHAHFDHLDRPTLRSISHERTTVVVPHRCARLVPHGFQRVVELAPGDHLRLNDVDIEAMETRHWGARFALDRRRGVCAYVLRHNEGSVLLPGDTAHTHAFDTLRHIDLACFGIGAYDPWEHMHATPEQAWRMFVALGARWLLPIHHATFELSDEPLDEPLRRLRAAAGDDAPRILDVAPGEVVVLPRSDA